MTRRILARIKRPNGTALLALALSLLLIAAVVAVGVLTSHPSGGRAGSAPTQSARPTTAASSLSHSDVALLETSLDSQSTAVESRAIVPNLVFAPGSPAVFSPGVKVTIQVGTFRHVGAYGLVVATTSDNQTFTLYLHEQGGHWLIFYVASGNTAHTTAKVAHSTSPIIASLTDAVQTAGCISAPQLGTRTPIILVHGFMSSPAIWGSASDPSSMLFAVSQISHVYVTTFDYGSQSTSWVNNPAIGPAFARDVQCLAAASKQEGGPGKVIVVAHSMGGLVARYAASIANTGSDMGLVVEIGTPNLGSDWANWTDPLLTGFCTAAANVRPVIPGESSQVCPDITALQGLSEHSTQINQLPWLPSGVTVHAIAGNETVQIGFGHAVLVDKLGGDYVVGTGSALASHSSDTTTTVSCNSIWPFGSCWHLGLPNNPAVERSTVAAIKAYIASNRPTPAPTTTPTTLPSAFWLTDGGNWYVHGVSLTIKSTGTGLTGTMKWNEGPCNPATLPGIMCSGNATLTFQPVSGGIEGTFTRNAFVTPSHGTDTGGFLLDSGAPQKGQTIILMAGAPYSATIHLTSQSPTDFQDGNPNLCQTGSTTAEQQLCGA